MIQVKPRIGIVLILTGMLMSAIPSLSNASSVSLVATSDTSGLINGDIVSFDVFVDFSDVGGTTGGGFDVFWDPVALQLNSAADMTGFQAFADPSRGLFDPFYKLPDTTTTPGLAEGWSVGTFGADPLGDQGPQLIGSLLFLVLSLTDQTEVGTSATNVVGGDWVGANDFLPVDGVEYNSVTLNIIPIPATVWLFGTALLVLVAFSKRRKSD